MSMFETTFGTYSMSRGDPSASSSDVSSSSSSLPSPPVSPFSTSSSLPTPYTSASSASIDPFVIPTPLATAITPLTSSGPNRPRAPSAPSCTRDVFNLPRHLLATSRRPSINTTRHVKTLSAASPTSALPVSPTSVRRRLRRGGISKRPSGSSISALPSEFARQRFASGASSGSGSEVETDREDEPSMVQQQHQRRRSSAVAIDVNEGDEDQNGDDCEHEDHLLEMMEEELCEHLSPDCPSSSLPPSPKVCEPVPLPSLDPSGPSSTSPPSSADAFAAQQNPNSPLRSTCNLPPTPPTPSCGPAFQTQALPAPVFDGNFPLGQPLLKVSFCAEEGESSVPPCFYPGQTIPTTLLFELPRFTSLPHALRPVMTMSLVGTLICPTDVVQGTGEIVMEEKSLINVGVSLEEGLRLWGKDAGLAWDRLSERKKRGRQDPRLGLPGGKYTLPLTVQVPTHPKLPPSFDLPSSSFQIAYHLEVTLTIDNPMSVTESCLPECDPERVVLVSASQGFTLLPTTLPTAKPELPILEDLVRSELATDSSPPKSMDPITENTERQGALIGGGSGWIDRLSSAFGTRGQANTARQPFPPAGGQAPSWSIVPSIPTSTFSPSSIIPLDLTLLPPLSSDVPPSGVLFVKASLIRREHVFYSAIAPSAADEDRGLIMEEELASSSETFDFTGVSLPSISPAGLILPQITLPLGYGSTCSSLWNSGFTTSLTVSPDSMAGVGAQVHSHCSSRFFLSIHVAHSLPSSLEVDTAVPRSKTLLVPITIGSVGEPQGARHRRTWRELYLERDDDGRGEERGRMVSGSAIDEESGWMCPPPSYGEACLERAYVL